MKKLSLIILVLISISTYAQNIRVGFTSGISVANFRVKLGDDSEKFDPKVGFTTGILLDIPAGRHFSIQPALNFVQKGMKEKQTLMGVTIKSSMNVNYVEVPLNFLYNSRRKAGNFFAGGGPSFAIGVSGKYKFNDGTNNVNEDVKFGDSDEDDMKSFDLGANIIAGFSMNNGLMFALNYNAGLNNLLPKNPDDGKLTSRYFGIRIGYILNTNRRK
jgi:hypothetical protein